MNLHSFVYQNETRPNAQFTKITSRVSKTLQLKKPLKVEALSSETIVIVRNGNFEKTIWEKLIGFWLIKKTDFQKLLPMVDSKLPNRRVYTKLLKKFYSNLLHKIRRSSRSLKRQTKTLASKLQIIQKNVFDEKTQLMQRSTIRRNPNFHVFHVLESVFDIPGLLRFQVFSSVFSGPIYTKSERILDRLSGLNYMCQTKSQQQSDKSTKFAKTSETNPKILFIRTFSVLSWRWCHSIWEVSHDTSTPLDTSHANLRELFDLRTLVLFSS